jgi:hypothetical protein
MANEFLRQTTDAALASRSVSAPLKATIQTYRAEARFLRALSYWHGLDLFGNIPLVTENDPVGGAPPRQATRATIYAYVVSELNAIRTLLPAAGPSNYGRATTAAADMLLAEIYLNAGVYTGTPAYGLALTSAANVIAAGYTLDPSYAHLFQADNNTSPEIIFPIESDGNNTQTYGGTTFLIHAECGGSIMSASDYGMDYCWGGTRLKPEAYNLFAAGDHRGMFFTNGQTVAVTTISNFNNGIASIKYTTKTSTGGSGKNPTFVDTDFPLFRLGEAYLIYAEAHVRGGGGTDALALQYMNALRTRAYGNASANFASISQVTTDTILAERGRELLWEAHRRTDLVRFGLFTGGTYKWAWKGGIVGGQATDAKYNLYPLPATEIVANPNLTQNPGY